MLPKLKTIHLTSGQEIDVSDGVTVIVGPNNAGKSVLLRETMSKIQSQPGQNLQTLVVDHLQLEWPGNLEAFIDWIDEVYGWRPPGQYPEGFTYERTARVFNGMISESQVTNIWGDENSVWALQQIYALQLDAQSRLGVGLDGNSINSRIQAPSSPPQHLYFSRDLEEQMSKLMKRAFGEALTVDRYAGNEIHLLVGSPMSEESKPPPSDAYLNELSSLRRLAEQGDGMRAFMGMLLTIKTSNYRVIFIDEPEAFLHPPQARLLGRILAEQNAEGTQVVVATHSEDIVQGITGAAPPTGFDPTIVRISRNGTDSNISQIAVDKVKQLYHDPLLRHSSVLSGLFYQGVVVCEGDSDCTYYQAVLMHLNEIGKAATRDIHFMHCGGKARIWKATDALKAARVPAIAVVDFDVLKSDDVLAKLVAVSGADLTEITADLNVLRNEITTKNKPAGLIAARAEIAEAFNKTQTDTVTNNLREAVSKALSGVDGWRDAKQTGSRALAGEALNAFKRIDSWLRLHQVFVVPGGELESFNLSTPAGDKSTWLATVLEKKLYITDDSAHDFVKAISERLATS